ncbi:AcrR family transcriptional regulator [Nonomuraea jabiensis]|uniref:AcrR family transcriptional regulator n=1 Tax=Nonomuraea jabiensis TaxID=882448 RepID=A0A7W9LGS1_9ACTN|nr:AcrR family transcriptional regulator [Nonomuraea jabiensis]
MDMIATEAGVAKHTIDHHFGDKRTVLRETIATEAERAMRKNPRRRLPAAATGGADSRGLSGSSVILRGACG